MTQFAQTSNPKLTRLNPNSIRLNLRNPKFPSRLKGLTKSVSKADSSRRLDRYWKEESLSPLLVLPLYRYFARGQLPDFGFHRNQPNRSMKQVSLQPQCFELLLCSRNGTSQRVLT